MYPTGYNADTKTSKVHYLAGTNIKMTIMHYWENKENPPQEQKKYQTFPHH